MSLIKIALFGKNGQLGWELQRSLACLGELIAFDHSQADFTQPESLAVLIEHHRPNVIVNAAAYTAVDKAESDSGTAHLVNCESVAALAQVAKTCGALLIHYSTDYVFDGSGSAPWKETDSAAPLNSYGASKLAGEQAIVASGCKHLIFRTSWVYAARGGNFAKTMLRLAQERDTLSVINDQFGAPTGADWLADMTAHALLQTLQDPCKQGLYHTIAAGETTWHGYASFVVEQAKAMGYSIKTQEIIAVPSGAFPTPAKRPNNSRLSTQRFQNTFSMICPAWQQGVQRMIKEITA